MTSLLIKKSIYKIVKRFVGGGKNTGNIIKAAESVKKPSVPPVSGVFSATPKKGLSSTHNNSAPQKSQPTGVSENNNKSWNSGNNMKAQTFASSVPDNMEAKIQYVNQNKALKNIQGKEYKTIIADTTTSKELTETQLAEELKERTLAKKASATASTFKIKDGSEVIVGQSKNNVQITQFGHGYVEKYLIPIKYENDLKNSNVDTFKFRIVTPPQASKDMFIESGNQKHLLIATDNYASGYLTSQVSAILLCNKQYKQFVIEKEKEKTEENPTNPQKKQYFVAFKNIIKISEDTPLQEVQYSEEYLEQIINKKTLLKIIGEQIKNPMIQFNNNGITKDDALLLSKEHDNNVRTGSKHPISAGQTQLNLENAEKNKQISKDKKINASKHTADYKKSTLTKSEL